MSVELCVYNAGGKKVRTVFRDKQAFGDYVVSWDGKNDYGNPLPSGVYFLVLRSDHALRVQRAVYIR